VKTLLLAPHHDDETLFASFICLTYRPLVVVCFGKPEANGVAANVRTGELIKALFHLRVPDFREWPLSDATTSEEELEALMLGLREDWDLVFAPSVEAEEGEGHGHPQHNLVGRVADRVFANTTVEHYTTYTMAPLARTRSNRPVAHDPSWLFRKHAALSCYRSAADTPSYRHFLEDLMEYLS
jgi:LmbE family N-acetylglucosaminyl deacetylase